jgi:hypothetical protein
MSALPPAADHLFELFKGFTQQALREPPLRSAPAWQVFQYSKQSGAFVVWFHSATDELPHVIGYLPASGCVEDQAVESFRIAVQSHEHLDEVLSAHERSALLRTLYAVFDGEAEGTLECRVPVSSAAAAILERDGLVDLPSPDDGLDAIPVSWRALALDVLSGTPAPKGDIKTANSYEVWTYRHDPATTVILRYFDAENAWTAAACRPAVLEGNLRFEVAFDQLLQLRVSGVASSVAQASIDADFERLELKAAMSMLGTALGIYLLEGGIVYEPGLFGSASADTLARVNLLRTVEGFSSNPDSTLSHFQVMACVLLDATDPKDQVRWTVERESSQIERLEILKHRTHPGILFVHFDPSTELTLSACYPQNDLPSSADAILAFEQAMLDMVVSRQLLSTAPRPMPDISPFLRVKEAEIDSTLETAVGLLTAGTAATRSYNTAELESRLKQRHASTKLRLIERPQGTSVH